MFEKAFLPKKRALIKTFFTFKRLSCEIVTCDIRLVPEMGHRCYNFDLTSDLAQNTWNNRNRMIILIHSSNIKVGTLNTVLLDMTMDENAREELL